MILSPAVNVFCLEATCASVANLVQSFVAGVVLAVDKTGSVENVFAPLIVCAEVKSTKLDKSTISAIGSQAVQFHTTLVPASNVGAVE